MVAVRDQGNRQFIEEEATWPSHAGIVRPSGDRASSPPIDAWEQRWGRHRYAASSRIWFTLWNGALTQVYYPIGDRPEFRDLQHFITDGEHRIRIVEALLSAAARDEAG